MGEVGSNPARIIPAWQRFVEDNRLADRPVRGIGEPIRPERGAAELVECQRHESLLNLAFADSPAWRLLCPYDTSALDPAVIDEAHRSHPFVVGRRPATDERDLSRHGGRSRPLRRAATGAAEPAGGGRAPRVPAGGAPQARLPSRRATPGSTLRAPPTSSSPSTRSPPTPCSYAGGRGTLRVWREEATLICEMRDGGHIDEPLAGRVQPTSDQERGWGLWLGTSLATSSRSVCSRRQRRAATHAARRSRAGLTRPLRLSRRRRAPPARRRPRPSRRA